LKKRLSVLSEHRSKPNLKRDGCVGHGADGQIPENVALHEKLLVCYDCAKTIGDTHAAFLKFRLDNHDDFQCRKVQHGVGQS
jgi:hypothetical protein